MSLDDVEGDGKSPPHSVARHFGSEKRNENLIHIPLPDPCPVIRDSHEHLIRRLAIGGRFGLDSSTMGQGIHCVVKEMDNCLMQLLSIAPNERGILREQRHDLNVSLLEPSPHEP